MCMNKFILFWKKVFTIAVLLTVWISTKAEVAESEIQTLSLMGVVSEIVSNNPEIQFYKEAISSAEAGVRYSSQWNDPELSFDVGYKKLRDSSGSKISDGAVWQVSVMQVFEWPGRIDLRKTIAQKDVELAKLGVEQFENALSARAKVLAFGLYCANAKAEAIREVAERFKSLKESFLVRESGGVAPLLETRVIESNELVLQRRATEAELGVQASLIELNLLRGANVDSPIRISTTTLTFKNIPELESLVSAARAYNFEYRMKQVELEQQGFAVYLARNERYPSVAVGPYMSMDRVGERETIIGMSVSLPIPLTDKTSANVDIALSKRRQAQTAAMLALRELNRHVFIAAKTYSTKLDESRRWSDDAVEKFREAAELADRHFRMGSIPITTYVELQNSYLDALEALLDTKNDILEAAMKLQLLTGLDLNPQSEIK